MDRLDAEVQYRIAKWVFTNMMINGEITVEEYTEIHKKLIETTQNFKSGSICEGIY